MNESGEEADVQGSDEGPDAEPVVLTVLLVSLLVGSALLAGIYGYYWYANSAGGADPADMDWCFEMTGVDTLHRRGLFGEGVVIGLVDTGMDMGHPDLENVKIKGWKDLINGRAEPYDDEGHGTEMAGIIFGNGSLVGVAPKADCILVKAVDSQGTSQDGIVASAIYFCIDPDGDPFTDDGADVISLSLGSPAGRRFLGTESEAAVREATWKGVVVVAAAGNDGESDDGQVDSPSTEELAICIGAVDRNGIIAPFSSVGNNGENTGNPFDDRFDPNRKPEAVAPGVNVVTCARGGGYVYVSGTSPATAMAAGIMALVIRDGPPTSGSDLLELKTDLMNTARPLDGQALPHDPYSGYGLIRGDDLSEARR